MWLKSCLAALAFLIMAREWTGLSGHSKAVLPYQGKAVGREPGDRATGVITEVA